MMGGIPARRDATLRNMSDQTLGAGKYLSRVTGAIAHGKCAWSSATGSTRGVSGVSSGEVRYVAPQSMILAGFERSLARSSQYRALSPPNPPGGSVRLGDNPSFRAIRRRVMITE